MCAKIGIIDFQMEIVSLTKIVFKGPTTLQDIVRICSLSPTEQTVV